MFSFFSWLVAFTKNRGDRVGGALAEDRRLRNRKHLLMRVKAEVTAIKALNEAESVILVRKMAYNRDDMTQSRREILELERKRKEARQRQYEDIATDQSSAVEAADRRARRDPGRPQV